MFSLVPYQRTNTLFDDFERLFGDSFWGKSCGPTAGACKTTQWSPAVDIEEDENRYLVKADLPGVESKDVEITLDDRVLSIKGERSEEKEETNDGYRRIERVRGSFSRSFRLPEDAAGEDRTP